MFSLTIQSEVWKPEYSNLKNPVTQEFVDRLKKAVSFFSFVFFKEKNRLYLVIMINKTIITIIGC